MKSLLLPTLLLSTAALLAAPENRIANGEFDDPAGPKPHVRSFFADAKLKDAPDQFLAFSYQPDETLSGKCALLLDSRHESGINEINYRKIPVAGKEKFYLLFRYKPLTLEPDARVSCRLSFFDAAGKFISNQFSAKATPSEGEWQDFLYSGSAPEGAASVNLTLWFGGRQKSAIDDVFFGNALPAAKSADGNLLRNGTLETASMTDFYIRTIVGGKDAPRGTGISAARDASRCRNGKYALLCRSAYENGTNEINFNNLPFEGQCKYRFGMEYLVVSREGKNRVSGRIAFWNKEGKVISYLFPEADATPGKWQKFEVEFFPPPGTARITATLWLSGKMEVCCDDFFYGTIKAQSDAAPGESANLLKSTPDFTWLQTPAYGKPAASGQPEHPGSIDALTLSAAANETEPLLLTVVPKKKMVSLQLRVSDLTGPDGAKLPASAFRSRVVGFVELKNPDNPALKGPNADLLLPESSADAAPGRNLPFYLTVTVPPKQAPGLYTGSVTLCSGENTLAEMPLQLKVRAFELPQAPALKTFFYAQPTPAYRQLDPRPHREIADNLQALLGAHRMSGNQAQWPPAPKWEIRDGKFVVTDWTPFDDRIRAWHREYGLRQFTVPLLGMMGDNSGWFGGGDTPGKNRLGFPWFSEEGDRYIGEYARAFTEHVRQEFPDFDFLAYIYDEPPAKVHAQLRRILDLLHRAAPDLKIFMVKNVSDDIGYVHTWCVPFSPGYINREKQARELAAGRDVWYYNWPVRIDRPEYIRSRLFPWQIYANDGNGGLLWNTVYAPSGVNPLTDLDKTPGCGSATIFYPPRKPGETMIPSLRSAAIREGIEDFDYLRLLEQRIDRDFPGLGKRRVKELVSAILPDLEFGYVNDPAKLYALRERIGDELEAMGRSDRPALLLSTPGENAATSLSSVRMELSAPAGTEVRHDGQTSRVPENGKLEFVSPLREFGENIVTVTVGSQTLRRHYLRREDPQLDELRKVAERIRALNLPTAGIESFLAAVRQGTYGDAEQRRAAELLAASRKTVTAALLNRPARQSNPASESLRKTAREMFDAGLFPRAEYYLKLADEFSATGKSEGKPMQLERTKFRTHDAFRLTNGTTEATVLEAGARIVSLKYNGVELLDAGSLDNHPARLDRAARDIRPEMVRTLSGAGGFEDAGGDALWPVSYFDWDFSLPEWSRNRVILAAQTDLPGTTFRLRRVMSMSADKPDLTLDYEITNKMPKNLASDDPEHYELPWRARLVPALGGSPENDELHIPSATPLPATRFHSQNGTFYELRSIPLTGPSIQLTDDQAAVSLKLIPDRETGFAYLWFNSKGDHTGNGKTYTVELPRSFYGKRPEAPDGNRPLTIPPGETLNFRLRLVPGSLAK